MMESSIISVKNDDGEYVNIVPKKSDASKLRDDIEGSKTNSTEVQPPTSTKPPATAGSKKHHMHK